MILPTKGISTRQALLALGADVLRALTESMTVSRLWHEFRLANAAHVTFDRFVLTLDMLYALGAVELEHGRLRRATPSMSRSS